MACGWDTNCQLLYDQPHDGIDQLLRGSFFDRKRQIESAHFLWDRSVITYTIFTTFYSFSHFKTMLSKWWSLGSALKLNGHSDYYQLGSPNNDFYETPNHFIKSGKRNKAKENWNVRNHKRHHQPEDQDSGAIELQYLYASGWDATKNKILFQSGVWSAIIKKTYTVYY